MIKIRKNYSIYYTDVYTLQRISNVQQFFFFYKYQRYILNIIYIVWFRTTGKSVRGKKLNSYEIINTDIAIKTPCYTRNGCTYYEFSYLFGRVFFASCTCSSAQKNILYTYQCYDDNCLEEKWKLICAVYNYTICVCKGTWPYRRLKGCLQ